jgi:cyclopropane fatty-acyl-phospholipid synthase-like methyltransferase
VLEWAKDLPPGGSVLDLGCGHEMPISQTLVDQGFAVYGVGASASMIAAFRARFPGVHAECVSIEESEFFGRTFDGVVAWGLIFLLTPEVQSLLIRKVSRALNRGGCFLFTAPLQECEWSDALTGRKSVCLGIEAYRRILTSEGLALVGERLDEGENHYYLASRQPNDVPEATAG